MVIKTDGQIIWRILWYSLSETEDSKCLLLITFPYAFFEMPRADQVPDSRPTIIPSRLLSIYDFLSYCSI